MTKQEILEYFKDINAMYNECTRYDDLSRMLNELEETMVQKSSSDASSFCCACKYYDGVHNSPGHAQCVRHHVNCMWNNIGCYDFERMDDH